MQAKNSQLADIKERIEDAIQHLRAQQSLIPEIDCPRSRQALLMLLSNGLRIGSVARLVGIEGGVVSGVFNLESSGVSASDWRPRHDEHYHEA